MSETNPVDLNNVGAFVRVMEAGSFTAAARMLGVPKSSVSRRITALERALRVRLIQRGTRKLILTDAGRLYFDQVRSALGRVADANAAVSDMSGEVAGLVRFTAAADNTGLIAKLITEFIGRHQKMQIDVVMTSRRVDLVSEGFDLALRAGPLEDSSLIARRLGRTDLALFASRAYLRKAGRPRRVSDLVDHRVVLFGELPHRHEVRLTGPAGEEVSRVDGQLIVHDMQFAADATAAGAGIGLIPEVYFGFLASAGMGSTRRNLERVLPDHYAPGAELTLVSPPTVYEPTRVTLFRDFLAERLRPLLQPSGTATKRDRT